MVYATQMGVGWILFVATFIIFPIRERLTNAKQVLKIYGTLLEKGFITNILFEKKVQIMAGVHPLNFWLSNLTWDMVMFTIVDLITTLVLALSDKR